ncbi:MAG: DNA methyltransferase [Gammaproteobacteria bacterium]|nr:DNA methyltransferase [Gammaproteobacteria bacterium]
MVEPNWKNRTLFHGDNLKFMRAMNSESVDLIATDPPFNKGRDFHATPDSLARGASFQDRWSWEGDIHEEWIAQLENDWEKVWEVINSTRNSWGDDMGAYLCFMAVRLIAMKRLLKPSGSIYLHCDPTASHYLKMLMDAIFGRKNFRNEIIWCYEVGGRSKQKFASKHDILLYYSKSNKSKFNADQVRLERRKTHMKIEIDENGTEWQVKRDAKSGKIYRYPIDIGVLCPDWWSDIQQLNRSDPQRTGYPTQKPLALYERVIKASTDENDIVLDPFAGCATTCVAAEKLNRQWVGIDIWPEVQDVVVNRLENESLIAPKYTRKTPEMKERYLWAEELHFTNRLPKRTDDGKTDTSYLAVKEEAVLEGWQRIPKQKVVDLLQRAQWHEERKGIVCGGCGRVLERPFMHLDHIRPRSDGGANDISNRILLCAPCNIRKQDDRTMRGLRQENVRVNWMVNKELAETAQIKADNCAKRVKRTYPNLPELTESVDTQ